MERDGHIAGLGGRSGLRLGVMGGVFDPIHIAHLVTAQEALIQFSLDQVIFMPAGDPPHKHRDPAPGEFRYLLVSVATAGNPRFSVSRHEIDRPGASYTVETLEYLTQELPRGTQLFFITGADAVLEILTWKDPARVLALSTFVAATRPGYDLSRLAELWKRLGTLDTRLVPEDRVRAMEVPALAISSSMIRERLAQGRPVRYLVPDLVAELIDKSGYYAGPRVSPGAVEGRR